MGAHQRFPLVDDDLAGQAVPGYVDSFSESFALSWAVPVQCLVIIKRASGESEKFRCPSEFENQPAP
jgi:hypothetical protein